VNTFAGKTTLLSVITNSIQSNVEARANVYLPGHSAFCPQEDHLHGFFTSRSYLQHYARLTGLASQPDIQERIDRLLKQLGLAEQSDTIVGDVFLKGLSGGQKRRLSIALEALSQPQNFFLDECTSGQDAESALQIMQFLREYVREGEGRRVILTIHQPSSFIWNTIDHVILLAKGTVVYNGSREAMEGFFEEAGYPTPMGWNRAEHYVTVVNDEFRDHELTVDEWAHRYQAWAAHQSGGSVSSQKHQDGTPLLRETSRSKSPLVLVELTRRYFLNLAFNPGILGTRIAMVRKLSVHASLSQPYV